MDFPKSIQSQTFWFNGVGKDNRKLKSIVSHFASSAKQFLVVVLTDTPQAPKRDRTPAKKYPKVDADGNPIPKPRQLAVILTQAILELNPKHQGNRLKYLAHEKSIQFDADTVVPIVDLNLTDRIVGRIDQNVRGITKEWFLSTEADDGIEAQPNTRENRRGKSGLQFVPKQEATESQ